MNPDTKTEHDRQARRFFVDELRAQYAAGVLMIDSAAVAAKLVDAHLDGRLTAWEDEIPANPLSTDAGRD